MIWDASPETNAWDPVGETAHQCGVSSRSLATEPGVQGLGFRVPFWGPRCRILRIRFAKPSDEGYWIDFAKCDISVLPAPSFRNLGPGT